MKAGPKPPTSLKVVAFVFVIGGVLALVEILVALSNDRIKLDYSVLGFFVGPGLLALRPFWRTCALILLWVSMIGVPLFSVIMLMDSGPVDFTFFGQKAGQISKGLATAGAIAFFALSVWQYRILTRPDIRKLFGIDQND